VVLTGAEVLRRRFASFRNCSTFVLHEPEAGTSTAVRDFLVAQGASPVQVKVPHVLVREDLLALVRARVATTWR
jgi:hypothetical protein